jgi:hypothetical protein
MSKFKPVTPEAIPASEKPHFDKSGNLTLRQKSIKTRTHELETDFFLVIDPKTGEEVGKLYYPLEFCGLDTENNETGCEGLPFSYHRFSAEFPVFVHSECWRPRREYWNATFGDMVKVNEGVTLPWAH